MPRSRRCGAGRLWTVLASAAALVLPAPLSAQANELWPELDMFWRPARQQRTMLELSSSTERESDRKDGTVGLYQDHLWLPGGYARVGYRFTKSLRGGSFRESRVVGEVTASRAIAGPLRLLNRTRTELRWVNGAYSWRLRDRIQLQYGVQATALGLIPYGTIEAYYDSKYRTIARIGGRIGAEATVRRNLAIDVYLARQNNSRSAPRYVNALGTVVKLTLR